MNTAIDYQVSLNPAQLRAVMTLEGPLLVIAGAGSGKTRTLVYRVACLVEKGVPPESILLLTFTRKAAGEMLERAASLADERCRHVSGGTFHSLAHRLLRSYAELLAFENAFTVLDRSDMEEALQSLVQEMQVEKGSVRFPKRATLANIISKAANLLCPVESLMGEEYAQFLEYIPHVKRLQGIYRQYKRENQLMDYDDLILFFRQLLAEHPGVRRQLGEQYRYIMVDEYQDTNTIQADIVKWLAHGHRNIMVVGDDSQAIYSFRGANYKNMFEFPVLFPEAKIIKLEENYRSTQPILTFTNALMERAREKYTKCLFTSRGDGTRPRVVDTRTEPEQAMFVCRSIKERLERGWSLGDLAVLFRAAYHSFELEVELARQGIPFVKYGGFKFMESAHIKDLLAYLRVALNREDAMSWGRILRLEKNIGQGKSHAIMTWLKESKSASRDVAEWPGAGRGDSGLKALSGLLRRLSSSDLTPEKATELAIEYYAPILREKFDDFPRREKDLEQLLPMASRYRKLRPFLDDLVLEPPTSSADLGPSRRGECLTLSTVHSAKGLEWSVVYIIWAMDGYFPSTKASANPEAVEEERRLMYVAATRAKDELIISYPGQEAPRSWFGMGGSRPGLSSFIQAMPGHVVDHTASWSSRWAPPDPSMALESRSKTGGSRRVDLGSAGKAKSPEQGERGRPAGLRAGDRVTHPAFGAGVVSRLVGEDKVEVLFRDHGRKLLHLGYTTLEKR